jgi:two-component system OmpR family sensor kinase
VAAWLLLLLAASVVMWMRREAANARRLAAREQLLARAYHELQTPLMLLRAAAESLERGAVERPDELRRCMGIVAREEERLTRSIRRLLRWLRVEGGGAEAPLAPLREEVEAAAREQEPALRERGVRLELALDGAASALRAPRDLVADVVRELLVNVEKHARGATRVRVALTPGPRRDTARIVVEDDGPGWGSAAAPPASGFGLGLLREGLLLCDGELRLEPREGARGARAVVEVTAHGG